MAARKRRNNPEEVQIKTDGWIATFGDLISLMLTFFVLIVSMSTLDELTLKDISSVVSSGQMSVFENASTTDINIHPPQEQKVVSLEELLLAARQKATMILKDSVWRHKVKAIVVKDKLVLRLPAAILFEEGKADLKTDDIVVLKRLARLLASTPGQIRIEGHTSTSGLPSNSRFSDLWHLSLARAASVLHVLEAEGVNPSRLSLVGYGPSKPISTNVTPYGRNKNERVDIVLYQQNRRAGVEGRGDK